MNRSRKKALTEIQNMRKQIESLLIRHQESVQELKVAAQLADLLVKHVQAGEGHLDTQEHLCLAQLELSVRDGSWRQY